MKTTEEAQKKANELWGENGFADFAPGIRIPGKYVVGEINGPFKQVYGAGTSWEDAFKNAHFNLN